MTSTRSKGRSTVVWLLMGLLLLGLGGFGVENFANSTAGNIGRVGDVEISSEDYLRAVQAETQAFAAQTGENMTGQQALALGVPQAVQARLFTAAALEAEARRLGLSVGDAVVAEQITSVPAFRSLSGQFDAGVYADVLRRQGLTVAEFESDVRADAARVILQRAVVGGIEAPNALREGSAGWLLERRDIAWAEVTPDQLSVPVTAPDEEALVTWHQANSARFTAPETRRITYAWLTPEMLEDSVELDDQSLREMYQQRIDEFRQPERRMVERLVYPSEADAQEAMARLDRGEADFTQLAAERGLDLSDIDLGEVTQSELGAAGEAVFALDQPGVVGPFMTDLGPALFSMNAILDPVDIPFEQAAPDLRAEAAADRARRVIEENLPAYEDLLAGGATLEDLAEETPLQVGQIEYSAATPPEGIAAYPAFRERAAALSADEFPQLYALDDGGVFALRLDELVPPAVIPFEEARDEVLEDWRMAETTRRLVALAEEQRLALDTDPAEAPAPAPASPPANAASAQPAPATDPAPAGPRRATLTPVAGVERDGAIEGAPYELVAEAFRLAEPGEIAVVKAEQRVFLVRLDAIRPADLSAPEAAAVVAGVGNRLTQSLQSDVFDYYARALQGAHGVTLNSGAINAANAQIQ